MPNPCSTAHICITPEYPDTQMVWNIGNKNNVQYARWFVVECYYSTTLHVDAVMLACTCSCICVILTAMLAMHNDLVAMHNDLVAMHNDLVPLLQ